MTRHQPVMAACAHRGEVLSAGHPPRYDHGGLGFVSMRCSVIPSISSIVVMSGRLPAKTSDPFRKAFRVEHQTEKHLFAIRARIVRVATLRCGVGQAQALEVVEVRDCKAECFL